MQMLEGWAEGGGRSLPTFSSNCFNFLVKQVSGSAGESEDGGVVGGLKWLNGHLGKWESTWTREIHYGNGAGQH